MRLWSWHFLSPEGHPEFKHAHDHKDIDVYVPAQETTRVIELLTILGFAKVRTKYDSATFRRYEKTVELEGDKPFRITYDFFTGAPKAIEAPGGWKVVSPEVLLSYYGKRHSSDACWAVAAAKTLLTEHRFQPGEIVGQPALLVPGFPEMTKAERTSIPWKMPELIQFLQKRGVISGETR